MLLIDAYNALHVTGVLPPELAGLDVGGLAELIGRSRWRGEPARLVCDGAPSARQIARQTGAGRRPEAPGLTEVLYAGPGRDADSLIESLIERDSAPRRLLVVSSDHRLRAAARRRRAKWMPSEAFLLRLAADHATPARVDGPPNPRRAVPLPGPLVEDWAREFGVAGLELPASPEPLRLPPAPASGRAHARAPSPALRASGEGADEAARLLRAIHEEWGQRLDADDLDMSTWLARYGTTPPAPD